MYSVRKVAVINIKYKFKGKRKVIDYDFYIGKKINHLTILDKVSETRRTYFYCVCDCKDNNYKYIQADSVIKHITKSCGCLLKKHMKMVSMKNKKYNKYDLTEEYGIGYTFKNEEFYFDLEDYDKIKSYCWRTSDSNYIISSLPKSDKKIRIHRLIMNCTEKEFIDHINGDKLDNRKSNLRLATKSQNTMNTKIRSNNTSGTTGVFFDKRRNKWIAVIKANKKNISLGAFELLEDAKLARESAEIKYFKEFRNITDNLCQTYKTKVDLTLENDNCSKSSGTKDSIDKAEKSGKEVIIMEVE